MSCIIINVEHNQRTNWETFRKTNQTPSLKTKGIGRKIIGFRKRVQLRHSLSYDSSKPGFHEEDERASWVIKAGKRGIILLFDDSL